MTFSGSDALVANTYSKSVQRAAVEEIVCKYDNVDYFPSYEIITLTNRSEAYERDNIHALPYVVDEIMDRVVQAYSSEQVMTVPKSQPHKRRALSAQEQLNIGKSFMKEGEFDKAAVAFSGVLTLYPMQLTARQKLSVSLTVVGCLIKADQRVGATEFFNKIIAEFDIDQEFSGKVEEYRRRLNPSDGILRREPTSPLVPA